jgi:hypothetical protein
VEKLALFCNPASGGTEIALYNLVRYNKIAEAKAKAKVFPHLDELVFVEREIPHVKVTIVHHGIVISKNKCVKKSVYLVICVTSSVSFADSPVGGTVRRGGQSSR